jgi:hypothetical protein
MPPGPTGRGVFDPAAVTAADPRSAAADPDMRGWWNGQYEERIVAKSRACQRTAELISASMDRPLTLGEKVALGFHFIRCSACRRYQQQLLLMRDWLRRFADRLDEAAADADQPMPDDVRARVRDALTTPEMTQRVRLAAEQFREPPGEA